jgi:hypothetical protein
VRGPASAVLGGLFLAALAVVLPVGLHLSAGARDLRVTVRSAEPYEIVKRSGATLAPAVAGPPELLHRLELEGAPDRDDPGMWLRTWQVTYGHRWERQVTVPVLAGAFDAEGKPWPCAVAVRFSPRFFENPPGGEDVVAVIDRLVRAQFPFEVLGLRFARVGRTRIDVRPEEGGLLVSGVISLADSARDPTAFSFSTKIALGEHDGDLTAKIERVSLTWSGATRHDPMVALASMFIDVDAQARAVLTGRLGGALAFLKLPKEPLAIFDARPGDRFTLRLCDAPESHADGVTLRLRLTGALAEPRLDPAVPGPPHLEARPTLGPAPDAGAPPSFDAAVSAAGVQQALYVLWQSGELAAWGRQARVIGALRDKLQDRLAFDLEAVSPHLPPVVLPGGDGDDGALRVRFGDLELGSAGGKRVAAHGDLLARARVEDGVLGLSAELADLRVNCIAGHAGEWRLTPCFSDVVPVLRESGLTSAGLPLDLPIPDRLLRIDLVLGSALVLQGLTGEVSGSPPELRVRGEAKLVRR